MHGAQLSCTLKQGRAFSKSMQLAADQGPTLTTQLAVRLYKKSNQADGNSMLLFQLVSETSHKAHLRHVCGILG